MSAGHGHAAARDGTRSLDGARLAIYRRVLWSVLAINGVMFLVEGASGLAADSVSLQADALDFLGDAATYGISLMVLGMSLRWRAGAALLKGTAMGAFGIWVLGASAYHIVYPALPSAGIMSGVGVLALVANLASAFLLYRFRAWRCQRALGVAVYAQRCDRQHRRRRSRRRGVRHRHRLARPWRRCGHGGAGAFEFVPRIAPSRQGARRPGVRAPWADKRDPRGMRTPS